MATTLQDKLRHRDHALILLGIASAIIIWWLLHRKHGASPVTEIVNQGGITFPDSPWPSYGPDPLNMTRAEYNLSGGPLYSFQGSPVNLSVPTSDVGIENCGCGCSDIVPVSTAPRPLPILITTDNDSGRAPVYVIQPPPANDPPPPVPAPRRAMMAVMG